MNLVFIHGFSSNSLTWSLINERLVQGYQCHFIDLIGFDHHLPPPSFDFQLRSWSTQVSDYISTNIGTNPYCMIAHSMGAAVTLDCLVAGLIRPQFVVMVNPLIYPQKIPLPIRFISNNLVDKLVSKLVPTSFQIRQGFRFVHHNPNIIPPSLFAGYKKLFELPHFRNSLHKTIRNLSETDHTNTVQQFSSLHTPAYMIRGMTDRVIVSESFERMRTDFDFKRVFELDKCGHVPQEECPERFNALIEKILLGEAICEDRKLEQ